jgi:hypothetical protein
MDDKRLKEDTARRRLERMICILLGLPIEYVERESTDALLKIVEDEYKWNRCVHSKEWTTEMKTLLDDFNDDIAEEELLGVK